MTKEYTEEQINEAIIYFGADNKKLIEHLKEVDDNSIVSPYTERIELFFDWLSNEIAIEKFGNFTSAEMENSLLKYYFEVIKR